MKKKEHLNAECIICGKKYHLCSCPGEEAWKWCADTANCYKIYKIIQDFNDKVITKDEAKDALKEVDLTEYKTFKPHNVKFINMFLGIEDDVKDEPVDAEAMEKADEPVKTEAATKPAETVKPENKNGFSIRHDKHDKKK